MQIEPLPLSCNFLIFRQHSFQCLDYQETETFSCQEQPYSFRPKVHLAQYLPDPSLCCICLSFNPTRSITCLLLRQKLGFIESRLQLVVKSAEDMPWYKYALKMMLQGKAKAAIPVNNTPALSKSDTKYSTTTAYSRKKSELGTACGKYTYCDQ